MSSCTVRGGPGRGRAHRCGRRAAAPASRSRPRNPRRCSVSTPRWLVSRGAGAARSTTPTTPARSGSTAAPGRFLRWVDGVAVVTDGSSLLATSGADAAEEWMFLAGRPSLVVADGPFAAAAVDAGVEVVAFAGLDRVDLAVPAVRTTALHSNGVWWSRCTAAGRPAAYAPLVALLERAYAEGAGAGGPEL